MSDGGYSVGVLAKRKATFFGENDEDNAVYIPFRTGLQVAPARRYLVLVLRAFPDRTAAAIDQIEEILRTRRGVKFSEPNNFDVKTAAAFVTQFDQIFGMIGIIARIARSALIDVGQEDFISTAVAKGLSRGQIVRRHLLPNAAIPITTIIGLELGVLMSGTIIVEVIFSWPGVGSLLFQAVNVRDTPLTTGVVVVYTTLFIALNVLIDLFYFIIDPRVGAAGGVRH